MNIKNHILQGVEYKKSPNQSGTIVPKLLIIHYTAASTASSAIGWMLDPKSKKSAHVHIARDGSILQLVEFNKRAYHAGKSSWKGVNDLNWRSIGIELQNTGKQEYTKEQIDAAIQVSKAIIAAYPISEILGHSDVSPGRKIDPGPLFPMAQFRKDVYGAKLDDSKVISKKTTADLNIREGAGTNYKSLGVLKKGTEVNVLKEENGWAEAFVCATKQHGFVSTKYLT